MQPLIDYSRSGEPLIFSRYLSDSVSRMLIEVDAGDGLTNSLSRGLIDAGWRALLIESDPKLFRELKENAAGLDQVRTEMSLESEGLTDIGLLVLNGTAIDFRSLRPNLILTHDGAAGRGEKYDRLSGYGYVYCGLAGDYSIWSREPVAIREPTSAQLPAGTQKALGHAEFDNLPGDFEPATTDGPREVMISGWAFADTNAPVPPLVWVEIVDLLTGGAEYVQAHRCWRPEVNVRFKRKQLGLSGFRALISLSDRPPKSTRLQVLQADHQTLFRSHAELLVKTDLQPFELTAREGLARKFLSGSGIEIGALQRPLPMPKGCRVRYIDRISLEELRCHYPELGQHPLQAPDFLDDGERLPRVASGSQDFVIANHFFEHSENPIQTLRNLLRVIRRGGILYMGVPDKRYTFDFHRPVTRYEVLKQTYQTQVRADREWLFEEWARVAERRTGADAEARIAELLRTNYSIHYNIWTLDELLAFLLQARSDFQLPFQLISAACCDNEAILLLERT